MRIALAGNPNSGKTTLFNALTGSNQYVGNWPGVTVEKKEGKLINQKDISIIDLPGIYSLSPYTSDEIVAREYLVNQRPDVVINVVDGTNLERNLFLTTQLIELGIPTVIAINMMDAVEKNGDKINAEELSKRLRNHVVTISALNKAGIENLIETAKTAAGEGEKEPQHIFSGTLEHALAHIEEACLHEMDDVKQRWYAIKIFERDKKVIENLKIDKSILEHIEKDITDAEKEENTDAESIISNERYVYIGNLLKGCYVKRERERLSISDQIDRIVTNKFLAFPIFAIVIFLMFFVSVSTVGGWLSDWVNNGILGNGWNFFGHSLPSVAETLSSWLTDINCAAWLQSLIVNGILAGVGAVLSFVPQIFILFFCLGFLEACGYMSRIAFILDQFFRKFGLSGKSFIPILIGTGCGVPGIMASRTIENLRDRRMTIITTTFIPCGAKLPVIALIAGALFHGAWWVAPSAYLIGICAIMLSGIILKKTKFFEGEAAPFIMELPAYRMPSIKVLLNSMWERGSEFIKKAGTIILIASIVIWFLSNFGWSASGFGMVTMDESILAAIGSAISFIFIPLGWGNWQPVVATITGIAAKENIVGTLGVLYGGGASDSGVEIWNHINMSFTALSGYSFLVFNLLCAPCIAAISAIKTEMHSGKWTFFAITYQCLFAYVVSLMIYQFGSLFNGDTSLGTIIVSIILLAIVVVVIAYMVKERKKGKCLSCNCGYCNDKGRCEKIDNLK